MLNVCIKKQNRTKKEEWQNINLITPKEKATQNGNKQNKLRCSKTSSW